MFLISSYDSYTTDVVVQICRKIFQWEVVHIQDIGYLITEYPRDMPLVNSKNWQKTYTREILFFNPIENANDALRIINKLCELGWKCEILFQAFNEMTLCKFWNNNLTDWNNKKTEFSATNKNILKAICFAATKVAQNL